MTGPLLVESEETPTAALDLPTASWGWTRLPAIEAALERSG